MATAGGVKVVGLRETVRDLEAMGVAVADLKAAFRTIAVEGARLAAGFAPHKSGRLAASVKGSNAKNYASVKAGGARVPYVAVQNYGWEARGIVASRFMQRADLAMRPRAVRDITAAIDVLIASKGLA